MNKLKFWIWPLLLFTLMTTANIIYWLIFGNGEHNLSIWLNIVTAVLCGLAWSNGIKLGFIKTDKKT